MKFSVIRSAAAALVATLSFAACAGHGVVPSTGVPTVGSDAIAPAAASPCMNPKLGFLFGGAFAVFTITAKGGNGNLPAYKGLSLKSKFGSTNVKGKVSLLYCDATGKGDITGKVKGHSFPAYKGSAGSVVLYLEGVNGTKTTVGFASTPAITISGKFPAGAKKCTLLVLQASGKWLATPLVASISGGKVAYPSVPNLLNFGFPPGSVFLGTACK